MLERLKASFSKLGVLAGAYLPPDFKETLLTLAGEHDRLSSRVTQLEKEAKKCSCNNR
jgi:hypothetical protein